MSEFEFVMIMGITVLLPIVIVGMTLRHKRWKLMHLKEDALPADDSLEVSELKEIIRDVVAEATNPMLKRIDRLEKRHARSLNPKAEPEVGLLDTLEEEPAELRRETGSKDRVV